jgi:hypothetical protein
MMSFNATVQNIRDGELLSHLTDELDEVVRAVMEHGKVGTISLSLKIKPNGEGAVTITPTVNSSPPKGTLGDALFFVSDAGLVRQNPRQRDIEDELQRKRDEREAG